MQNTDNKSISLTNTALARIDNVMNANSDLGSKFRVYVTGGGCSGFQYGFKFDKEVAYDDDVIEFKNLMPSAENIAIVIYDILKKKINKDLDIEVTLYETPRNFVKYTGP